MSNGTLTVGRWRVEVRASVANDTEFNRVAFDSYVASLGTGDRPLRSKASVVSVPSNPNTTVRQNRTNFRNEITSALVLDVTANLGRNELCDALALALQAGRVTGIDRAALTNALLTGRAVSSRIEAPFTRGSVTTRRTGNVGARAEQRADTAGTPASAEGGNRVGTTEPTVGTPVAPVAPTMREAIESGPVTSATDPTLVGTSVSAFSSARIGAAFRGEDWMAAGTILATVAGVVGVIYLLTKDD